MLAHYLAVALAKFRKAPFTTTANVLTLALGLACFVAAYGIASWWSLSDHHHERAARTLVIGQGFVGGDGGEDPVAPLSSPTLARHLAGAPEIETVARALRRGAAPAAAGSRKASFEMAVVDPDLLRIFDFRFLEGDASTALDDPAAVVLTEAAAARLFGPESALGRPVIVDGAREGVVTGVIVAPRQPSFMGEGAGALLPVEMIRSLQSLADPARFEAEDRWFAASVLTFVTLRPGVRAEALQGRLDGLARDRVPAESDGQSVVFEAFPVSDLVTRMLDNGLFASGTDISAVAVLVGLGMLTLLVACVNYGNLATAQAVGRAKEVGLRKVLGAGRAQVGLQAFVEATLAAAAGVVVATAAVALAAPAVRAATGVEMVYVFATGAAPWGVLASLVVLVGLLAGAYPALVLSGVRPAEALAGGKARKPPPLARILVGVQFASASFLLILVTVMQLQRAHLEQGALAPNEDPVVTLPELSAARVDHETLLAQLAAAPGVKAASIADRQPWDFARNPIFFTRTPAPDEATIIAAPMGYLNGVGYDYFETVGLSFLAGRDFDRERETAPSALYEDDASRVHPVVLDLAYAERLGFASAEAAVGQNVYMPAFSNARMTRPTVTLQIIGVTEPDVRRLEASRPAGNIYVYAPALRTADKWPVVRLAREDVAGGLAAVTAVWDRLAPTAPADIRFVDDLFELRYRRYARAGQVFALLAASAFAIASIGQIGAAVHATSRRRHEIGVRKILGATVNRIVRRLLIDFSKPVLIANLLAWPLGYLAAQTYLAAFAERVPLTPAPFALSMAITLAIAWAAVIGEVLRAASVRPAEVLRHA
jgi:putative ABC transport system permease protein